MPPIIMGNNRQNLEKYNSLTVKILSPKKMLSTCKVDP